MYVLNLITIQLDICLYSDNDPAMFQIMPYIYRVYFDNDPTVFRIMAHLLILITCLFASFQNDSIVYSDRLFRTTLRMSLESHLIAYY